MDFKTGGKAASKRQQQAVGGQKVDSSDVKQAAKAELAVAEQLARTVLNDPKKVVEAQGTKNLSNFRPKGSADSGIGALKSSSFLPDAGQVLPEVAPAGNQEKKLSECGSVKDSSASAKVSDGNSSLAKTSGSAKISDRLDFVESGKSSICRGSTSTDVSDESSYSSFSSGVTRPHKANDLRWEAIQAVRARDGVLGLSHFRLLKRLGCGDIGSVYLSELSGTRCYFAVKVMDKASLESRKKHLRAQTEREILQSLDHPFLPTLYTHFETDKFSCLVMEFCPGGDLHILRQRQPGKYFPEHAAKYVTIS